MTPAADPIDPLTGFYKREVFEARFPDLFQNAISQGHALTLAFLDVDEFKPVNDDFGQAVGDAVLKEIAATIQSHVDDPVMVVRYGGDEFLLLFPNTVREEALLTLEKIRAAVAGKSPFLQGEGMHGLRITISAGISSYPVDANTESELKRKADQALYRAKKVGKDKIRLAHEEKMAPKTSHYTQTQLERLSRLAEEQGVGEAVILREALDDLLMKYGVNQIET